MISPSFKVKLTLSIILTCPLVFLFQYKDYEYQVKPYWLSLSIIFSALQSPLVKMRTITMVMIIARLCRLLPKGQDKLIYIIVYHCSIPGVGRCAPNEIKLNALISIMAMINALLVL